jgi:hypothetical protein
MDLPTVPLKRKVINKVLHNLLVAHVSVRNHEYERKKVIKMV